jgi:hypothetical protein
MVQPDHSGTKSGRERRQPSRLGRAIGLGLTASGMLALLALSLRCSILFSVEDFAGSGGGHAKDGASDADADADADAACVADADHGSDALNCGACGHSCLGGGCKAGKCEPFVLAAGKGCPSGIAVYDDEVYWTEWNHPDLPSSGRVARVLVSTRAVTLMAETTTIPVQIAADEGAVYWSENSTIPVDDAGTWDGHVYKLEKSRIGLSGDAGAPEVLSWGEHTFGSLALSTSDVYFTAYHVLNRVSKDGGPYVHVSPNLGQAAGIAIDTTGVYFADVEGGAVWYLGSGDASLLVSGDVSPLGLAVDSHNLYWTNFFPNPDAGQQIMTADKFLPGDASSLAENQNGPLGIALDGSYVYWTNIDDGRIMRVAKAGGAAELVATGNIPRSIAVDNKLIYWTDCGSSNVMALAK